MRSTPSIILAALLGSSILSACGSGGQKPDPHSMAPTTTDKKIVGRTTLAMPIPIPGQSTVVVPFAIESEKDWFQTTDPFSAGGLSASSARVASVDAPLQSAVPDGDFNIPSRKRWFSGGSQVRWHNAIARDVKSAEEWPILEKRGVISSWSWFGSQTRRDTPIIAQFLLFLATTDDTNHDGLLNDLDARVAIVAGPDGRHPRAVTPANAQVWSTVYDAENDRIYLLVVADTNGDGKFDYNDALVPYVCDASGGGAATPVVSESMLRRVEGLLK